MAMQYNTLTSAETRLHPTIINKCYLDLENEFTGYEYELYLIKTARLLKKYYGDYSGIDIRYDQDKQSLCREITIRLRSLKSQEREIAYDKPVVFVYRQTHPIFADYRRMS